MTMQEYNFQDAVNYHYGQFPPKNIDYEKLAPNLIKASTALAKYDALLTTLPNSEILLAPLRRREAVISSRIEGTIATLDEILKYEADEVSEEEIGDDEALYRTEVLEVYSYTRAMNLAQKLMNDGLPISGRLLKKSHSRLLIFGRGSDKQPGEFKTEQNYIIDRQKRKILFIPVDMSHFDEAIRSFEVYSNLNHKIPILQTAICHAEFESIHPFKDGNGRLGRMLITLMLWDKGLITQPYFYMSGCIEKHKDDYLDLLRDVSSKHAWTEWCDYFLKLIAEQAEENTGIAEQIRYLYEEMKEKFRAVTSSQWSINALDFVFASPVFRNGRFKANSGIPSQTANRITNLLAKDGLLTVIEPAAGRRSALYAFEPLLQLTRA